MSQTPKERLAEIAFVVFFVGSFVAAMFAIWPVLLLFGIPSLIAYLYDRFFRKKS